MWGSQLAALQSVIVVSLFVRCGLWTYGEVGKHESLRLLAGPAANVDVDEAALQVAAVLV